MADGTSDLRGSAMPTSAQAQFQLYCRRFFPINISWPITIGFELFLNDS